MVFWHEEWQKPSFQVYGSLLFGLPLAVTSFNRYSKFVKAMGRLLLRVLVSLYFDDAHLTDWVSDGPSVQWAFGESSILLGTPFAEEKRQSFASSGTTLGFDFDFQPVNQQGLVTFWARDRLLAKVKTFIADARETGRFTPGIASKLYGALNFLESGMFGRVGCGGMASVKDHQYQTSSALSPSVDRSFDLILAVLQTQPKRFFWLALLLQSELWLHQMRLKMLQVKDQEDSCYSGFPEASSQPKKLLLRPLMPRSLLGFCRDPRR